MFQQKQLAKVNYTLGSKRDELFPSFWWGGPRDVGRAVYIMPRKELGPLAFSSENWPLQYSCIRPFMWYWQQAKLDGGEQDFAQYQATQQNTAWIALMLD